MRHICIRSTNNRRLTEVHLKATGVTYNKKLLKFTKSTFKHCYLSEHINAFIVHGCTQAQCNKRSTSNPLPSNQFIMYCALYMKSKWRYIKQNWIPYYTLVGIDRCIMGCHPSLFYVRNKLCYI